MKLLDIINEEINEFDFLGHNKRQKETNTLSTLNDMDFQKQFIIDSVDNPSKINLNSTKAKITGDWKNGDSEDLTVEYITEVNYNYNDEDEIEFILSFTGENIAYNNGTDNKWFNNIDLDNVVVEYFDIYGKKLDFKAYKAAPDKIKYLFKKKYIGGLFK